MSNKTLPFVRRDDIAQGTDAWHEWRSCIIGSSDAPVIMGENPWKSVKALLDEKLGLRPRFMGNAATRRGSELEPQARAIYELSNAVSVTPSILQNNVRPWQAASVDGINSDGDVIVEIKCGIRSYEYTEKTGKVSPFYIGQLQHIMAVSGLSFIDYFLYIPGKKNLLISVKRDAAYIEELICAEEKFMRRLSDGVNEKGLTVKCGAANIGSRSTVVSRLYDGGDKIKKSFSDLKQEMIKIISTPSNVQLSKTNLQKNHRFRIEMTRCFSEVDARIVNESEEESKAEHLGDTIIVNEGSNGINYFIYPLSCFAFEDKVYGCISLWQETDEYGRSSSGFWENRYIIRIINNIAKIIFSYRMDSDDWSSESGSEFDFSFRPISLPEECKELIKSNSILNGSISPPSYVVAYTIYQGMCL